MVNYKKIIDDLKAKGLIAPNEIAVTATDDVTTTAMWFGAIGAAVAMAKAARYLLCVGDDVIKIFHINKDSETYEERFNLIKKENITKIVIALGGANMKITVGDEVFKIAIYKKLDGYKNVEEYKAVKEKLKTFKK